MYYIAVISKNNAYLDNAVSFLTKYNSQFRVRPVSDPSTINDILKTEPIDIYVCDHDPPRLDAQKVFERRLAANDFRPFIVASKLAGNQSVLTAFESGISLWVPMDDSYAVSFMKISRKIVVFAEKYRAEQNNRMNDRRLKSLIQMNNMHNEDFNAYMSYALEESISLTNSTIGYLAMYDKETQMLDMKTWSKRSMEQCMVEGRPMKYYLPKAGLWGEPIRMQRPFVINDYNSEAVPRKGLPQGHIPLRNLIMIPLMHGGEVIGTAGVGNKIGDYDETDLNQFILMMDGLTHIYTEKKQEEEAKALQHRLRNVLMNSPNEIIILDGDFNIIDCSDSIMNTFALKESDLRGPLPNNNWIANDIISLLEKIKYTGYTKFTDTVISEKKPDGRKYRVRIYSDESDGQSFFLISIEDYTTIANMSGTIESGMLMRKIFNDLAISNINLGVRSIKEKLDYVTDETIRDSLYQNITDIETKSRFIKEYGDIGIIAPEWFLIADAFNKAIINYRNDYDLTIKADGVQILADYTFTRVFQHLLANAVERGDFTTATVSYKVSQGNLIIICEDDAKGIPKDKKDKLFSDDMTRENMDFFIISAIIKACRFTIEENGNPEKGARFEITVPPDRFEIL